MVPPKALSSSLGVWASAGSTAVPAEQQTCQPGFGSGAAKDGVRSYFQVLEEPGSLLRSGEPLVSRLRAGCCCHHWHPATLHRPTAKSAAVCVRFWTVWQVGSASESAALRLLRANRPAKATIVSMD
ncbi:hypothetical protein L228DRAFT_269819 [Xylona heveae TC161]|uniref:Uncharacterized protein n=1 Tax=Xylona heveae (strain CBS 132557 / TC161) TaxID=1328760 RepID=A0A165FVU3_XYLHT|nr:hypothetical protein L228DRAFT_269819 [Xylona heveae TC161]KZF21441.1 hypothetical protein L228DRAFT_269819 [Xylona heveae TC161]